MIFGIRLAHSSDMCVADYHYSYAEGNLVHTISDFAVRYDRWMMLSSFPGS